MTQSDPARAMDGVSHIGNSQITLPSTLAARFDDRVKADRNAKRTPPEQNGLRSEREAHGNALR
jgi:hypothetical protein